MHAPLADTFCAPAYRSFRTAAAVLERIISAGTSPISLRQIMHGMRFSETDARRACILLRQAGLIIPMNRGRWSLAVHPGSLTLADVWEITSADAMARRRPTMPVHDAAPISNIDLLISQALMGLQQNIAAHFAAFQLDSPGKAQSGFRYVNYRPRRNRHFSGSAATEAAIALPPSPDPATDNKRHGLELA